MNGPYLKIVHAVRQRDHEARVVVDGFVTENDVHTVVEIPEIVLGCRQLTAVVLWVVPARFDKREDNRLIVLTGEKRRQRCDKAS